VLLAVPIGNMFILMKSADDPGDFGSETQFFNSLHWKGAITTPIQVTFNIDNGPAANAATNQTHYSGRCRYCLYPI